MGTEKRRAWDRGTGACVAWWRWESAAAGEVEEDARRRRFPGGGSRGRRRCSDWKGLGWGHGAEASVDGGTDGVARWGRGEGARPRPSRRGWKGRGWGGGDGGNGISHGEEGVSRGEKREASAVGRTTRCRRLQ
jgi:hypothetical protein